MTDFVFYDTEATDADHRHGQITQFGAIRADAGMNPVEECELKVRRLPWVVPAPKALEVTGMSAGDLDDPARMSEYRASGEIERFLVPGYGAARTLVTFNGPKFDDELIRTTLFRNLRNPWFSSGRQTTRVDLLSVARLAHACDPGALEVPSKEDGGLSWRLEHLCAANGIEIRAHDALGDARATMELAGLLSANAPSAWATAASCGLPSKVESFLSTAAAGGRAAYLFTHFGQPEVVPCAVLGTDGKKKWILADLRVDSRPSGADAIKEALYSKGTPFPVIRSNAAPIFVDAVTAASIVPGLDHAAIAARAMAIKLDPRLKDDAVKALREGAFEAGEGQTSEERIYGGFVPDTDKPSMTRFHRSDWAVRSSIAFHDDRLADFAARIMIDAHMSGETVLEQSFLEKIEPLCAEARSRPHAGAGARWVTLASAMEEADDGWREWALRAFPDGDVPQPEDRQSAPAQLEMF